MRLRIRKFRARLNEIIQKAEPTDKVSLWYDRYILFLVVLSVIPLALKVWTREIMILDRVVTFLFVVDYILQWMTADFMKWKKEHSRLMKFVLFPLRPMAILDLLSILPVIMTFSILPTMSLTAFIQVLRVMRVFRCARFFKAMRYSRSFVYLYRAVNRERKLLVAVLLFSALYVFVSAAIVFSVEPDTFLSFFDALYWATVTLTTVGYGDIYPVTVIGRAVSMTSAIFGIAIVAMPAGIITSGFMEEVNRALYRNERKLETEVAAMLDEIRALRQEQNQRGLEEKIELIADEIEKMRESNATDTVLLQDLSDDLKNALAYGTMTEEEETMY